MTENWFYVQPGRLGVVVRSGLPAQSPLCSKPLTTMRNIEHLLILSLGFTNIAFAQNTRDYDDYRLIAPDFESFDIGNENLTDAVQVQAEHSGDSEDLVIETGEDDKSEMLAYRDTCLYRGRIGREGRIL